MFFIVAGTDLPPFSPLVYPGKIYMLKVYGLSVTKMLTAMLSSDSSLVPELLNFKNCNYVDDIFFLKYCYGNVTYWYNYVTIFTVLRKSF